MTKGQGRRHSRSAGYYKAQFETTERNKKRMAALRLKRIEKAKEKPEHETPSDLRRQANRIPKQIEWEKTHGNETATS